MGLLLAAVVIAIFLIAVMVFCLLLASGLRLNSMGMTEEVRSAVPRKVVLLGLTGCGKSTLAKKLSQLLGVEHFDLDTMLWTDGVWDPGSGSWQVLKEAVKRCDAVGWVCDGNYNAGLKQCWGRADVLVILDPPTTVRLARILSRGLHDVWVGRSSVGTSRYPRWHALWITCRMLSQWWQRDTLEKRLSSFFEDSRTSYRTAVEKRQRQLDSGQKVKIEKRPLREHTPILVLKSDDDVALWMENLKDLLQRSS